MNTLPDLENDYPTILDPSDADLLIPKIIDIDRSENSYYSKLDIVNSIYTVMHKIGIPPRKALKAITIKGIVSWINESWEADTEFQGEALSLVCDIEHPRNALSFIEKKAEYPENLSSYSGFVRQCEDGIFALDEESFYKDLEVNFPEIMSEIKSWENLTKYKLETFSRYTQGAIDINDREKTKKCFELVANHFDKSGKSFKRFISIAYVNKLSFEKDSSHNIFWAWEFFPGHLKNEYQKVIGEENI